MKKSDPELVVSKQLPAKTRTRAVIMPGKLMRFSQFSGVSGRDQARTRASVLCQEGSEDNRCFQWVALIFGMLARNKLC